jgi:hypothetical protein
MAIRGRIRRDERAFFGAPPRTPATFLPPKKAGAKKGAPRKSLYAPLGRLQGRRRNLSGKESLFIKFPDFEQSPRLILQPRSRR